MTTTGQQGVPQAEQVELVTVTLVPVEVFGGECSCHEKAEAQGQQGDCAGWGYGLMDAVQGWSDCNRAVGRIYRAEDLHEPGEDPAKYRTTGEVLKVQILRGDAAWFDRKWGDEANGRDSVAYIRGEVAPTDPVALPPLAPLVTDEEVDAAGAARRAYFTAHADCTAADLERAALEAYAARLLGQRTP